MICKLTYVRLLIRLSTTSFTVHDSLLRQRRPTFLMHDSRRKSAEKGLVSPISGTDWVIRIYRRNTRFLSADCRRYRIRFDKLHSLSPFLSFPSSRRKESALPPFSPHGTADCSIVRSFARHEATYAVSINSIRKFQRIKLNLFSEGEMMIIVSRGIRDAISFSVYFLRTVIRCIPITWKSNFNWK